MVEGHLDQIPKVSSPYHNLGISDITSSLEAIGNKEMFIPC